MELKYYPERVLRKKARPLEQIDDEVLVRAQEMLEFMYEAEGIGLAAPQVGWSDRLVTLDVEQEHEGERIFVNPRIVERGGHLEHEEGCLSLPGIKVCVPRAERVTVVAYTLQGERVELEAEGLHACAWQHEMDHLNGLLIIDRLSPTALISLRDQLQRLEREHERPGEAGARR
ncbi:MAG: peptide deformylase [Candidatus Brocadiaceae bacterium]